MKPSIVKTALLVAGLLGPTLLPLAGCSPQADPLVIYAGNGLKPPMEEIKRNFEQREGGSISIVYSGSNSLLSSLRVTQKGDIFIPGASSYIEEAGALVTSDQHVAMHVPTFAARAGVAKTYADLLKPGVRIAVGNKDMAAIGRIAEAILKDAPPEHSFRHNIVVAGSTVGELLQLMSDGQVDAALVWTDMLQRDMAKKRFVMIEIPQALNKPKEIRVATLSTSLAPARAARFAAYVAGEGRLIFERHGFGKK